MKVNLKGASAAALVALCFVLGVHHSAQAGSYATSTAPQRVHSGGVLVGESYGTYARGAEKTTVNGKIRDLKPGGTSNYMKITKTLSDRNATKVGISGRYYNDGLWVTYQQLVATYDIVGIKSLDIRTCAEVRYWFDPCSSPKVIYRK